LDPSSIGIAVTGFIWALLVPTYYAYKESEKLEKSANMVVEEKMGLIDEGFVNSFIDILGTLKRRKVSIKDENRDQLINISYIASDLKRLRDIVSDIRDEISNAFIYGVICGFGVLAMSLGYDIIGIDIVVFIAGYSLLLVGFLYIKYSVHQFRPMRRIEKGIRAIRDTTDLDSMAKEVRKIVR